MRTIEVTETEAGWEVTCDQRVLFNDLPEQRSFQAALDYGSRLFDEGVRAEIVLHRLEA
ncbi:hypothetical protein [Caulobacter hibisci]|uniref:Uncharacterized protein n=1 Tax=Caulobacter hibisci TaxID=2035993 RepID=A0ABS0SU06_9CAUL|nr:hypothetical protein [Caulobacter hibisci]MBI1683093.1 hypothetical protein [Caulobacter hibisci]